MSLFVIFLLLLFPHLDWLREIQSISLYSVGMKEITDQTNSKCGHFLRSDMQVKLKPDHLCYHSIQYFLSSIVTKLKALVSLSCINVSATSSYIFGVFKLNFQLLTTWMLIKNSCWAFKQILKGGYFCSIRFLVSCISCNLRYLSLLSQRTSCRKYFRKKILLHASKIV